MAAGALLKGMDPAEVKLHYGDVLDVDALQGGLADGTYAAKQDARRTADKATAPPAAKPAGVSQADWDRLQALGGE
jgi:hypothetical protein